MGDSPRIEELRRRVQADPASIAFAALAEEYRRTGRFDEAIETCLAGLKRHPSYLSAHVTLGRALIEVGRFDEAEQEMQFVLRSAPENLAAIRAMADIHHRRRDKMSAAEAHALSQLSGTPPPPAAPKPCFVTTAPDPLSVDPGAPAVVEAPTPVAYDPPGTFEFSPTLAATPSIMETYPSEQRNPELEVLEEFLAAVTAARAALEAR